MIGLALFWHGRCAVVLAPTMEAGLHILEDLYAAEGISLDGEDVGVVLFDPAQMGGIILSPMDESSDMDGWGPGGFQVREDEGR